MPEQGLVLRIKALALRGDQVRIARIITSNLHRTAFLSGPALAKECSVSTSAITRFAQKLGYKGVGELKRAMEALYRRTTTPYEVFEQFLERGKSDKVTERSLVQDLENLQALRSAAALKSFHAVVAGMNRARMIHLVGIGVSEVLVDYFHAFLEGLSKPTGTLKSYGITRKAELIDFDRSHLMIGFSFQRVFREVVELFKTAKSSGVTCVAVTDSALNPLAMEADHALIAPVIGTTFGLSITAPIALINLLANSLAALDREASLRSLKKAKEFWDKYPVFCEP